MNNTKVVFFDIDGTIFRPGLGVPESTRLAISMLKENGIIPVICTGRARSMIFGHLLEAGFEGIVAGGGTYVEYKGEVLYRWEMNNEDTDRLIKSLMDCGFGPIPEGHDALYYDPNNKHEDYIDFYNRYYCDLDDITFPLDFGNMRVPKVSARFLPGCNKEKMIADFSEEYTMIDHNGRLFEVIPKPFSKAHGIEIFINKLGIDINNTYAYGDSENDLEMIQFVKHGVAMGNAIDLLKEAADYVTDTIENDGVYKSLKELKLI